jgi:DNA-binding PadR family transcriptional regulator
MSVRHGLLALLAERPRYGYELRGEFETRTAATWPLNVGQVYTTLHRLEKEGTVASDGADGTMKRFRLTDAGAHELNRWLHTPPDVDSPPRDELVIKVQVALRMPGVDVAELLQVHRRHVLEAMQRYTHLKADTPAGEVGLGLVIDAELFRLESVARWLDAAEARLRHLPDQSWTAVASPAAKPSALARQRVSGNGGSK